MNFAVYNHMNIAYKQKMCILSDHVYSIKIMFRSLQVDENKGIVGSDYVSYGVCRRL